MLSTCEGEPPGQRGAGPGSEPQSTGHRGAQSGAERLQGPGVQEWSDGSRYEGEFENGLKHGKGRYTWRNGESYEGFFYKDYKHGDGTYSWPTGHKFIGKFYLNRKEGYGKQTFPDGATFQGLYHADQRFGPGVVTDPDGCQDVGLWLGEQLLKLCTSVEESFSLKSLPEYAAYMDPANTDLITQPSTVYPQSEARKHSKLDIEGDLLPDEDFILPPEIEIYSTDGDHLPLPPGRRRELDQHFYGELWEPDAYLHQGYERDPLSTLPLQSRMQAHIYKHRQQAKNVDWDVAAVLSLNRESFGPKGPSEVRSESLIQHASKGNLQAVLQILQTGLVHPDVADSRGHTALIAATVNCHNNVIHLLLDMGADIDKLNCEGMSALAVCHVLYYPFQSLHTSFVQPPPKTQVSSLSEYRHDPQISQEDLATKTPRSWVRSNTMKLLLERGADPNVCRVPMPVLFLAIMAGDSEAVRRLLLCGAHTDIPLPPERKGLYPLHVAAALPGPAGPIITELLLHAVADPDKQACDQDEIFEPDQTNKPLSMNENQLKAGGRTPLHVACQRESDFRNASKIVALLLSHGASTDLLWSGHSPLSLAIASGNDLTVEELLKGGADPNLPLGLGVGSALCVLANFKYHLGGNREKLLEMLAKAGADFLMPVKVGEVVGNAVDYAHHSFNQDLRIAHTPFHALNVGEREIFKTRRNLLSMMGDLLRESACKRLQEKLDQEQQLKLNRSSNGILESPSPRAEKNRNSEFKFCYYCCRSVSVELTACGRCRRVFFCSRNCKLKSWEERHKQECVKESGENRGGSATQQTKTTPVSKPCPRTTKTQTKNITLADGVKKSAVLKFQGSSRPLTAVLKPKTASRPLIVGLKCQRLPEPSSVVAVQDNMKENYSHN